MNKRIANCLKFSTKKEKNPFRPFMNFSWFCSDLKLIMMRRVFLYSKNLAWIHNWSVSSVGRARCWYTRTSGPTATPRSWVRASHGPILLFCFCAFFFLLLLVFFFFSASSRHVSRKLIIKIAPSFSFFPLPCRNLCEFIGADAEEILTRERQISTPAAIFLF